MWKLLLPLLLFIGMTVVLWRGIGQDPTKLPSPLIDKPAPQFSLPQLRDPTLVVSSQQLHGQAYLLNVWGSWCPECRYEHPLITQLAQSFPVYGLNWKDERSEALRWLGQFGDPYQASAFDGDGRVGIDFGVYGAPETFLIDAAGIIRYKHVGPLTPELIATELGPAIEALQ